jgi:hypothetical protein
MRRFNNRKAIRKPVKNKNASNALMESFKRINAL